MCWFRLKAFAFFGAERGRLRASGRILRVEGRRVDGLRVSGLRGFWDSGFRA